MRVISKIGDKIGDNGYVELYPSTDTREDIIEYENGTTINKEQIKKSGSLSVYDKLQQEGKKDSKVDNNGRVFSEQDIDTRGSH